MFSHIHTPKIGSLLAVGLAAGGTWLDHAQQIAGLIAICLSVLVSLLLLFNARLDSLHKMQVREDDITAREAKIAAEKERLEDAICEARRVKGICPRSTFDLDSLDIRLPHE